MEEENEQSKDEMRAYEILLKRHLNDDRLLAERSTIFLTSNSILFLGFVVLPIDACVLRIFLPILGIVLSLIAIVSNLPTAKGLDFWEAGEKRLESCGQAFEFMRELSIKPSCVYVTFPKWLNCLRNKLKLKNRYICSCWLPSFFVLLWVSALVWVIVN